MANLKSWMSLLRRAMADEFPWWNNVNYTHGAMRATGLAAGDRCALLFETIAYAQREAQLERSLYAFDPEREHSGFVAHSTLVPESRFIEELDDRTFRSRVTGVVSASRLVRGGYEERILVPQAGIATHFKLRLGKKTYTLPLALPSMKGVTVAAAAEWHRLLPEEVVLFQLVEQAKPNDLFATKQALKKQAGLPLSAKTLFSLDDWQHPASPDDDDSDLKALVRALLAAKEPKLSKTPNGDWRQWLDALLAARRAPSSWWGLAGEMLEDDEPRKRPRPKARKPVKSPPPAWLSHLTKPVWDAPSSPCAAMRARGFTTHHGPALVLEAIVASRRLGDVRRETYAYGPGATKAGPSAVLTPGHELVPAAQIYGGVDGAGPCRVARGESLVVCVDGAEHTIEMSLAAEDPDIAALADRAFPAQIAAYRLADQLGPDELFASNDELVALVGMKKARHLFTFDDWQPVPSRAPLAKSPDLVAMAKALAAGSTAAALRGKPSGGWRAHAPRLLRAYGKRERALWP